ncbi:MAG: hypothetical protein JNL18_00185 [Planctomycetaceae bacterium]|nr:hypothetical protein [Planctomycetaceae bacterium]
MAAKKSPAVAARKSAPSKTAAAPKQRTAATPRSASRKSTKAGDEMVTIDRRRNEESAPAPALERRAKVQRRRQIDPTTCERDYSIEEVEFMNAMDEYKRKNGRMFPTCSEVLEVIRGLGYVRLSPAGRAMLAAEGEIMSEGAMSQEEEFETAGF